MERSVKGSKGLSAAFIALATSLLIEWPIHGYLHSAPLAIPVTAAFVVTILYGFASGFVTAMASVVAIDYMFVEPTFAFSGWHTVARLGIIAASTIIACQFHRGYRKLATGIKRLEDANKKVTDALVLRDQFISIASHELRTPLTAMAMQLQSLGRKSLSVADADYHRQIGRLERSADRLSRLVENLLDVSKLTRNVEDVTVEEINVSEVVQSLAEQFNSEAELHGCKLTVQCDSGVLIKWDKTKLEQIVTNLLSNAVKYGCGGKVIEVELREKDRLYLRITDHGPGIEKEHQGKVFEPFVSIKNEKLPSHPGMGVGLWITKRLVALAKGEIRLWSESGKGTTFEVFLPKC